ncbi:CapA family protein [Pontibacillus sp. HMF3514]|uniref:CapA family protein n=1 Tax=Pontibacillus sp. HMF3514 TaxID=2692425 RepID=UPI00131F77DD|nr:CapA family protein [Pontibacillus sp. HMF3514]QHE53034.1 hypothetical protein GS400_13835 [Pontibacillus sp. HMF3514]
MRWEKGIIKVNNVESQDSTRITICSDWAPRDQYEYIMENDPTRIYGDLLPVIQTSDLSIVNVETTLGNRGEPIHKGGPNLRGSEKTIQALTHVPFHIGCLANNHTMDYGREGLSETINLLKNAGIQVTGAGLSGEEAAKPFITNVNDTTVGIINCAEGEECRSVDGGPGVHGLHIQKTTEQIRELKKKTDLVLVIFHGGREHIPSPPLYVTKDLRKLAKAGADAVISHHPHVPQGIEMYHGVPIVYSQGNFVFWQKSEQYFHHAGYMVHLDLSDRKIKQLVVTPYLIKQYGLELMKGEEKSQFLKDLQYLSTILSDDTKVTNVWDAVVDDVGLDAIAEALKENANLLQTKDIKGAAWLHNIFFTPAHRELYLRALKRATTGETGNAPNWAKDLVQYWKKPIIY